MTPDPAGPEPSRCAECDKGNEAYRSINGRPLHDIYGGDRILIGIPCRNWPPPSPPGAALVAELRNMFDQMPPSVGVLAQKAEAWRLASRQANMGMGSATEGAERSAEMARRQFVDSLKAADSRQMQTGLSILWAIMRRVYDTGK